MKYGKNTKKAIHAYAYGMSLKKIYKEIGISKRRIKAVFVKRGTKLRI